MSRSYYYCNECGEEHYSKDSCFTHYLKTSHHVFRSDDTGLDYDPTGDPQYEHQLSHFDPDDTGEHLIRPIDESEQVWS